MTRIWTALALIVALTGGALAQSPPAFIPPGGTIPRQLYNGDIPTATQWNNFFEAKQDYNPLAPPQCVSPIVCLVNGGPLGTPSSGNLVNATGYLANALVGAIGVPNGGTGQASFVAGRPLVGNGTNPVAQGTVNGNTTAFITADGTLINGHCPQIDSAGGLIDSGASCGGGGGGSGTVNAGTTGQLTYYASSGTAVSGATTGTGVVTALGVNTGSAGGVVVNGGALGTPASGTLTNATGLPLTTGVTGTLPVPNGGTGASTLTSGALLRGNGSSAVSATTTGTGVLTALGLGVNTAGGIATYPVTAIPNVSGSAQSTTGTIGAISAALTLAAAKDFVNGEGIRVNHAGAAFTASVPTGASVTAEGTTGSTTYHYEIASVDGAGGVGAVIASFSTSSGNGTLTQANYNLLQWTNGSGANGAAVYRQISSTYTLVGLTNQNYFADVGYTAYPFVDWLPTTAPASALADALVTTISGGGGSTSLTLVGSSTTAATSQGVYHDDGAALLAAYNAGSVTFPAGTFYVASASGIAIPSNERVSGQFGATVIQSVFLGGTIFTSNGSQDAISGLNFNLVPGAVGISSTDGFGSSIYDIICNGGANGAGGTPLCVRMSGAAGMNLDRIALNGWTGSGQGTATGGMTPAIVLEASSVANTLDHIILANDGQVTADMASIVVQDSFNNLISNSVLAADLGSPGGTSVQGLTGIEFSGSGQVLQVSNVSLLGYGNDISMDMYGGNSPQTLDVTNTHFDFCGTFCIALNGGSWVNINNNSFVGEGNAPWDIAGNTGVWTSSSFTGGPNTINGNTFNGFSGSGSVGVKFTGTMTNTTVCGNRWANNTTNTSLGSPGSGSVYGCSTSP